MIPSGSMTSEAHPPDPWVGDVRDGVAAWTGGASEAPVQAESAADAEERARKILLDQLTGQARSRKQLADKLARREVPDDIATRLLNRFEEVGLIDDEAFARMWVASRQPGKGLAGRALAQELRRKGVDDDIIREAVGEIDPEDEADAARALVRKKMRSLHQVDRSVATRRLVGMLARKGYSSGVAYGVVREVFEDFDEVPDAKSSRSMSPTLSPRDAASSAQPQPVMPPPTMSTSNVSCSSRLTAEVRSKNPRPVIVSRSGWSG